MSSIFIGKTGLRHQYEDLTAAEIETAPSTNAATAIMLLQFLRDGKMTFIDNTLNVDVGVLLVHPQGDANLTDHRLFWLEVPANRVINYDISRATDLSFDAGTQVFIYRIGAVAATSGKVRIATWG